MNNTDTKAGMAGGMIFTLLSTVGCGNVVNTVILSAVGAAASFITTMLCRRIFRK